jgi:tetraacyldisaccharide 4'-kinase
MREPEFWRRSANGWAARLLLPAARLYAAAAALRGWGRKPYRPTIPVIVAGGLTLGGAGKTPLALALAELLQHRNPHFLSRGYGGRARGPLRIDPARHQADEAGDEPLLLAAQAPTWVARDRACGAKAAETAGAGLVILDDGFQNPSLVKDLALLAIDGESGLGNGRVFPAGPLREPLSAALSRAHAVVLIGEDRTGIAQVVARCCLVLAARLLPGPEAAELAGKRVYAFAGIARPAKFFASLKSAGAILAGTRSFPDHHPFSARECAELLAAAAALGAIPVTTAKDKLRLPSSVVAKVAVLTVRLRFEDRPAIDALLARF